ncbi:DUF1015 family protein [Luedemannella flava]|uniref:DUF1015 family protein n=1 Tax=Luedemannella flava TaxID=349316 RepID=A0ABN2LXJ9_9ACTN
MTVVHPIARAWISTGGTGARNYDEFADDAEITEIIRANADSALAIEMPHRAPESLGRSFLDALPDAVARLSQQKADGSYAAAEGVVALYRIGEPDRPDEAAYGIFAMVDTDQISTSADEPGLVIRNEDVFIEKVRERVALADATRHLLSPVLLLQTGAGERLHAALRLAADAAGAPAVTDIDHVGRTHAVWVVTGELAAELAVVAGAGELVVADGNHRSLAAQTGGLSRFLAVITTPQSVEIQPYHRLVTESTVSPDELVDRLTAAGAVVTEAAAPVGIPPQGTIHVYGRQRAFAVRLPTAGAGAESIVDGMDHAAVERSLLRDALGLDPGDKRIVYVGGDYPPEWLTGEVDAGRADLAILIAPVTVEEFVAVNLARLKMPRKSTWFTPKARGGLVLADLTAE